MSLKVISSVRHSKN